MIANSAGENSETDGNVNEFFCREWGNGAIKGSWVRSQRQTLRQGSRLAVTESQIWPSQAVVACWCPSRGHGIMGACQACKECGELSRSGSKGQRWTLVGSSLSSQRSMWSDLRLQTGQHNQR